MLSTRSLTLLLAASAVALVISPVPPAEAGNDKVPGRWQENPLIGYKFRPLNEWAAVPPGTDPDNPKVGGFYSDKAKFKSSIAPECDVFAFRKEGVTLEGGLNRDVATGDDEDGETPGDGEGEPDPDREKTREEIIEEMRKQMRGSMYPSSTLDVIERTRKRYYDIAERQLSKLSEKKQRKIKGRNWRAEPTVKEFDRKNEGKLTLVLADLAVPLMGGDVEMGMMIAGFVENEEYEIGVIYTLPKDALKAYYKGSQLSCRTLSFLSGEERALARQDLMDALDGAKSADERRLAKIKALVPPGWSHFITQNYLLIFDKGVKPELVRKIALQIEAIRRDVYEEVFPPDREITAISVVRICKDKNQYHKYGGPGGSAGYWAAGQQELVFYYEKSDKDLAFSVLNHEAFHQYIFYSTGSVAPHSWFNEGHGDYFAGFEFGRGGRFVPKPFSWRRSIAKGLMNGNYVPLKKFVEYTQGEYYANAGNCYAQGWSLVWFLRRTRNPMWQDVLPKYFNTLKDHVSEWVNVQIEARKSEPDFDPEWRPHVPGSLQEEAKKKAIEAAFGHFDDKMWDRFEKEWRKFKY